MIFLLGGGSLWLSWYVAWRASNEQWGVSAFFDLLGLGVIVFFGCAILECLTAYQVDAEGITRCGWRRT